MAFAVHKNSKNQEESKEIVAAKEAILKASVQVYIILLYFYLLII